MAGPISIATLLLELARFLKQLNFVNYDIDNLLVLTCLTFGGYLALLEKLWVDRLAFLKTN